MTVRGVRLAAVAAALLIAPNAKGAQDGLVADTDIHGPALNFDWQDIKVGVGAYQEEPTGLTIIRFMLGAAVVVDSARRGRPSILVYGLKPVGAHPTNEAHSSSSPGSGFAFAPGMT